MADLDTLRPEVRKALDDLSYFLTGTHNHDDFYTIRAELLRLAKIEEERWAVVATRNGALERAEKAEAELAALKARMKPCARVRDGEVHVCMDIAHEGKEVAVVVVEE